MAADERDYPAVSALCASDGLTTIRRAAGVGRGASDATRARPARHADVRGLLVERYEAWQDRRDRNAFFDFDEPRSFREIGGSRAPSPCATAAACTTCGSAPPNARRRVLAIVDEQEVTVVALETGEILSVHRLEPDKGYWRSQR